MRLVFVAPILALTLALGACSDKATPSNADSPNGAGDGGNDTYVAAADGDGDGWTDATGDCNDADATVYPGADEACNGVDDNCNGQTDEGFGDVDGDGTKDCSDSEECDGRDNDGDGEVDEGFDTDGDGQADCTAVEICDGVDNNADGTIDEGFDLDGDGYTSCGTTTVLADCNDEDAAIHPGQSEVDGDLVDNDCDGVIDVLVWEAGDVILTEIMVNPGNVIDSDGEWFEVTNVTDHTVLLNGITISSSVDVDLHQITSDTPLTVEPGESFVLGANDVLTANGGVAIDYMYADIDLANEADSIVLEIDGLLIDEVTWDDGLTFPDVQGASMTLDPTWLSADLNDSGDSWCQATTFWGSATDFGTPGATNEWCFPVVVVDYDHSAGLTTCSSTQLIGSGSYDPEGLPVTYEWSIVSAPSGSVLTSSDIEDPTSADPFITPDVPGTYIFSLTVYNGSEYSPPATITLDFTERAFNTAPIADAGDDSSYSETATCTPISYGASYSCAACADYDFELDGTQSSDPDGDWLGDPAWAFVTTSSYATMVDEDTWTPTVTISGVPSSHGVATTTSVTVQLSVSDCMGAVSTDDVVLTHVCTGS
jgi:hypothetical protein